MTLIEHWEENKREDFDGGRQKDKTVIQYLWGISDSKLFHWEMRLMTDLILSSDIAAGLHIRTKTADDNIYSKRKKEKGRSGGRKCSFSATVSSDRKQQQWRRRVCQVSTAEMFPLQPEWQTLFHHVKSGLLTCQAQHIYWQRNFSLSARTPSLDLEIQHVVKIRKGAKCGKKQTRTKSLRLPELFIAALLPHSSLTSLKTPAALRWLSSSNYLVGSTLTQLRLYSSSSSSSAPASSVKSKTSSLTSTPTRLQNRYQHKLCSDCFFIFFFPGSKLSQLSLLHGSSARLVPTPALLWYGYESMLARTPFWLRGQLSTSSGFDSSLLLNLKLGPLLCQTTKTLILLGIANIYAAHYMTISSRRSDAMFVWRTDQKTRCFKQSVRLSR